MIRIPSKLTATAAAVAVLGSTALATGAAPVATAHTGSHPLARAVAAKSCSSGYVRGRIRGKIECLRDGEFCAHSANKQYHRYGFNCTHYYRKVHRYRLTDR